MKGERERMLGAGFASLRSEISTKLVEAET